jgi:GNAT superfamily N-acetyltransferase
LRADLKHLLKAAANHARKTGASIQPSGSHMTAEAVQRHVEEPAAKRSPLAQRRTRLAGRMKLGLYTQQTRYGLRRDLALPMANPNAKIPISVRPLENGDVAALFANGAVAHDLAERLEAAWRLAFIDKGARGGFVAVDSRSGTPCYVQWLFGSRDNDFIGKLGGFPPLAADEALLENAYTPAAYRGLGVMSAAMALIAERASEFGARYVLTFVGADNIASLKGCQRAGFYPHLLHHRARFFFGTITRDRFETLPESDPRRTAKF